MSSHASSASPFKKEQKGPELGARTLAEMCRALAVKHVGEVMSVGSLAYSKVRGLLMHVDLADQLRIIEENSPQIEGEDAECWQRLIRKKFMNSRAKNYRPDPARPNAWYEVYERYRREDEAQQQAAEIRLRAEMESIRAERESKVTMIAEASASRFLPKQPRNRVGPNEHPGRVTRPGGSSGKPKSKLAGLRQSVRNDLAIRNVSVKPPVKPTLLGRHRPFSTAIGTASSHGAAGRGRNERLTIRIPRGPGIISVSSGSVADRNPVKAIEAEDLQLRRYGHVLPTSPTELEVERRKMTPRVASLSPEVVLEAARFQQQQHKQHQPTTTKNNQGPASQTLPTATPQLPPQKALQNLQSMQQRPNTTNAGKSQGSPPATISPQPKQQQSLKRPGASSGSDHYSCLRPFNPKKVVKRSPAAKPSHVVATAGSKSLKNMQGTTQSAGPSSSSSSSQQPGPPQQSKPRPSQSQPHLVQRDRQNKQQLTEKSPSPPAQQQQLMTPKRRSGGLLSNRWTDPNLRPVKKIRATKEEGEEAPTP